MTVLCIFRVKHLQYVKKDTNVKKCSVHKSLNAPGLGSNAMTAWGILIFDSGIRFLKSNLGHLSFILRVSLCG